MPRHFWESAFQVKGTKTRKTLSGDALTASWFVLHSLNAILHSLFFLLYLDGSSSKILCVFFCFSHLLGSFLPLLALIMKHAKRAVYHCI